MQSALVPLVSYSSFHKLLGDMPFGGGDRTPLIGDPTLGKDFFGYEVFEPGPATLLGVCAAPGANLVWRWLFFHVFKFVLP